jgi:putative DNA primase/helicase
MTLLASSVRQPCWRVTSEYPAHEIVACRNGLLHLPSGKLLAATPNFFTANALDYDYDAAAPAAARWLDFLHELWPGDQESIDTLQEWTGYLLTPDTQQQKMLLIAGPTRAGKGVIGRVQKATLGETNTCNPTLASLGAHFGLSQLVGKSAAIISDARLSGRSDTTVIAERLLSISGEDGIDVDRKFLPALTAHRLGVRFTILTNVLPNIQDTSGALVGRLLLLRLTKTWYGKEDPLLYQQMLPERPGILLWAIEGWRRLQARGHFVQPRSGAELRETMADMASPVAAFLREECTTGPGCTVACQYLYSAWRCWCANNNKDQPGSDITFGRDLRAAAPEVTREQHKIGGRPVWHYVGVQWGKAERGQ